MINKLISGILFITFFTHCSSAQFDKNPPFIIKKVFYQEWFGGQPNSKGALITIEISTLIPNDIIYDSIFFKGNAKKLGQTVFEKKQLLSGNFPAKIASDKNIIMHADPLKEMANKPPTVLTSFPFVLTDNECVISYIFKNKKRYFKIDNLKQEKAIYYP